MTDEPLATLALAAALLATSGEFGSRRLGSLFTGAVGVAAMSRATTTGTSGRARWAAGSLAAGLLLWALTGAAVAGLVAAAVGFGLPAVLRRVDPRRASTDDPVELATAWAELAVCLEAGLPVPVAVAAAAASLDGSTGHALRRVAGLLELGGDPERAWRAAQDDPAAAAFARAAARSAATGAALARTARAESARVRNELTDAAESRAQRAGVLIAAPLGLCFLPAFLVLGVAPVVIGLAGEVLAPW